ncbi:ubiquitin family protein, partial [Dolichospermum sp. ST_sed9]|nr:ubiquitin family protein [Dolichospermum sp. ST_sed9]
KEKDEETKIKIAPPDLNNWGIIDEKNQSLKSGDDAVLYAQILSPTYSDKKYSGIYIKHEKNDEMIVDIHPCGIPLVLGSVQKYRPELEKADITLCGEKLAISVSSHNQSLASAEAIILDNSEIKLNHGKKIFGQAQQKVDFLSQNIELGSTQIEINSGQAKINSMVNVSFPSPKVPTPNVLSNPVVAGLTSGEVGGGSNNSAGNGASNNSAGSGSDKALTKGNNEADPKQVFMKGLDGKTKVLQITPTTKISELKKTLGYESADVYLVHGGKLLDEKATVADYPNIHNDSNIEIRGRGRGGGSEDTSTIKLGPSTNPKFPITSPTDEEKETIEIDGNTFSKKEYDVPDVGKVRYHSVNTKNFMYSNKNDAYQQAKILAGITKEKPETVYRFIDEKDTTPYPKGEVLVKIKTSNASLADGKLGKVEEYRTGAGVRLIVNHTADTNSKVMVNNFVHSRVEHFHVATLPEKEFSDKESAREYIMKGLFGSEFSTTTQNDNKPVKIAKNFEFYEQLGAEHHIYYLHH